jgi:rubrerythrin
MTYLKASDVVDLAMQVELSGEAYYRAVAKKAQSTAIENLFEHLADQEAQHYKVFSELGSRVKEAPVMGDAEFQWYADYLTATVQSSFFEGPEKALAVAEKVADDKEAVRMAIAFEKETLLFFFELRDAVAPHERDFVDRVVAEEKSHVRQLAKSL